MPWVRIGLHRRFIRASSRPARHGESCIVLQSVVQSGKYGIEIDILIWSPLPFYLHTNHLLAPNHPKGDDDDSVRGHNVAIKSAVGCMGCAAV